MLMLLKEMFLLFIRLRVLLGLLKLVSSLLRKMFECENRLKFLLISILF